MCIHGFITSLDFFPRFLIISKPSRWEEKDYIKTYSIKFTRPSPYFIFLFQYLFSKQPGFFNVSFSKQFLVKRSCLDITVKSSDSSRELIRKMYLQIDRTWQTRRQAFHIYIYIYIHDWYIYTYAYIHTIYMGPTVFQGGCQLHLLFRRKMNPGLQTSSLSKG